MYYTVGYWSTHTVNFRCLEKTSGLWIVSPPLFVYDFSRTTFLMLYSINWPSFNIWFTLLFHWAICVLQLLWRHKFWNWSYLANKSVFLHNHKLRQNFKILRMKRVFRWNKKHFSSFSNGFQLPKIVLDLRNDKKVEDLSVFCLTCQRFLRHYTKNEVFH